MRLGGVKSAESRFCHICKSGKVGDEIHFITECHVFTDERNMLFYNISKVCKNCNLLSHQKFIWPFSNENTDVIRMFSQFIYNSCCKQFKIALSRKLSLLFASKEKSGLLYDLLLSLCKVEQRLVPRGLFVVF